MKPFRAIALFALLALLPPFGGRGSDEIPGTVADVLAAIRDRRLGLSFEVSATVAAPPATNDSRFVIRDPTGSVIIRCDVDRPEETLRAGDAVDVRCEIGSTARTPAAAYFRGLAVRARNAAPGDAHGNWFVTARGDESAQVVKLPRGLTAARLALGGAALLALSLLVLGWNALLRHLVDRRSRELTDERLASFTADLKVEERTRLAIELHDTLAQTLTGVSLELDAARDLSGTIPAESARHLEIASRTLASCRNELRNCLWDLRNQTLDDVSMDEAVRRTLAPHLAGAALSVRFDVDRARVSDNTALAILRIVRELALNAVRHGRATSVRVAGSVEGGRLLFSVRDDRCGFDPSACPGVEQGHFGLQGIAERVERFGGTFRVESARAAGAYARIEIPIPRAAVPTS